MASNFFKFACPACGQHLEASMEDSGAKANCPACGQPLTVPEARYGMFSCDNADNEGSSEAASLSEVASSVNVGDVMVVSLADSVSLDLCGIPPGQFVMGNPDAGVAEWIPKATLHVVTLTRPFWLGHTQVTQKQWMAVMDNENPSKHKGNDLPVECVSFLQATEFCRRLNERLLLPAGWRFSLPTEAQWEYACRAGTTGERVSDLDSVAWHRDNCGMVGGHPVAGGWAYSRGGSPQPVAGKKPNAWGLYDMLGNVDEWCADYMGDFSGEALIDPSYPDPIDKATENPAVVQRGGSWISSPKDIHPGKRGQGHTWAQWEHAGFRVAAVVSAD